MYLVMSSFDLGKKLGQGQMQIWSFLSNRNVGHFCKYLWSHHHLTLGKNEVKISLDIWNGALATDG